MYGEEDDEDDDDGVLPRRGRIRAVDDEVDVKGMGEDEDGDCDDDGRPRRRADVRMLLLIRALILFGL